MPESLAVLGVIALPAIAPLIALINLLFPGLLGEHWKQYRAAIGVLLSQSTLMFVHWALARWVYPQPAWWLSPQALAWGLVGVAVLGVVASFAWRPAVGQAAPAKVERLALAGLLAASIAWLAYQYFVGTSLLDQMLVVAGGCVAALVHLKLRQHWAEQNRQAGFSTESAFLLALAICGAALANLMSSDSAANRVVEAVSGEWMTFRGNPARTGSRDPEDGGPSSPHLLWPFQRPNPIGTATIDSSPVVVDNLAFVGVREDISALQTGNIYCVSAADRQLPDGHRVSMRELVWESKLEGLRPVFASAAVADGRVYIGEGYHDHARCRLFCLDARSGELQWAFRTTSHVESPPTIAGDRIYFGAGDDGLYCLNLPQNERERPSLAWHLEGVHVDSGPLVVQGKVIAGGVVGDIVANLEVVAADADSGNVVWRVPSELPVPAAPAFDGEAVLVGLGSGKLNAEAEKPAGAVWRLGLHDGEKRWEFPLASSLLTSPIAIGGRVYFVARNGECYCLEGKSGQRMWKYEVGEDVVGSPIVSGGRMFVVTAYGSILCLDVQSSKLVWRFDELRQATPTVYSSPALVGGRIYVAIGGKLYCVGDAGSE